MPSETGCQGEADYPLGRGHSRLSHTTATGPNPTGSCPVDSPMTDTVTALDQLHTALSQVEFSLDLGSTGPAEGLKVELEDQIQDYLLPRLKRLDAPLLAVLGGSTGSGKSTITNSLVGSNVSTAGVLRPTTRSPVLICHPEDQNWFTSTDILPDLPRVTGGQQEHGKQQEPTTTSVLRIRPTKTMPPGLAIIDAPDIDSVEEANRELATQLLAAADLWLFVTTAVRYADAVPWDFLGRARDRGTTLSVIINRVPPGAGAEIVPHLESMLRDRGLDQISVFEIEQTELDDQKRLPEAAVAPLLNMLHELANSAEQRAAIIRSTLDGALASVEPRATAIAEALGKQDQAVEEIRLAMEAVYTAAKAQMATEIADGSLLHGEVLDRWQELIGTADLMRAIQSRITWARNRIGRILRGKKEQTIEVQGEITSTLEQIVLDHADAAALEVTQRWRQLPGGMQALGGNTSLERASDDLSRSIASEIRSWQDDILDLVRQRGEGKRSVARALALGINGVGVALMIVLFAQTGGLTGGEVAVASGTAAVSQTLLNALFGEQAVRDLTEAARHLLQERLEQLLDIDANRFRTHLWSQVPPPMTSKTLAAAITAFNAVPDLSVPHGQSAVPARPVHPRISPAPGPDAAPVQEPVADPEAGADE